MASVTTAPASVATIGRVSTPDADVATNVRTLLANSYPSERMVERRRAHRYPFPHLIVLTPVMPDGVTQVGPPVVAAGKQISETGAGLLSSRAAAVSAGDRLARTRTRQLDRLPDGSALVPVHALWLVRKRGPVPAIGRFAAECENVDESARRDDPLAPVTGLCASE